MVCILCGGPSTKFFCEPKLGLNYYRCGSCDLRFMDPSRRLAAKDEGERYRIHQNVATDLRYQEFLRPMTDLIREHQGREVLDFGCGEDSVIRFVLEPHGFSVSLYDPYFYPDPQPLAHKYDFVCATEVAEHLYAPGAELGRLRGLLRPGGRLGLMTQLCSEKTDFATWYYRRDPTHVAFYSRETVGRIREIYGFTKALIHSDRLIEFTTV